MTAIAKLIRFHRFQLDEKRRELLELEEAAAEIQTAIENLENQMEAEKKLASENLDASRGFGNFVRAALARRDGLERELADALRKVTACREEVREAFAEVKKFEITLERREAEAAAEADRRDQIDLDEIALNNHRRRR